MEGVTADFFSFEDFSSRMILLPRHDDECTGAKVGSHEVPPEIATDEEGPSEERCQSAEEIKDEDVEKRKDDDAEERKDDDVEERKDEDAGERKDEDANLDDSEQDYGSVDGCERQNNPQQQQQTMQVPVGFVLVKIQSLDGSPIDIPEDLESIEFADLLGFLREASFPLSLVFVPPNDTPISAHSSEGIFFADGESNKENTSSGPLDVEEELSDNDDSTETESNAAYLAALSRDDAAKYAKQAATELRGRLSRWGYQAATRAADVASQASSQVKERQRKTKDEMQNNEDGEHEDQIETVGGSNTQSAATEKPQSQDATCFIFLQTPSGFEQLSQDSQGDPKSFPPITNNSVVSVRLSEDKACLGKNGGYTFQWYRSNDESGIIKEPSMSSEGDKSKCGTSGWSLLRGACYAAYQPSVSDAGHRLRCIVEVGAGGDVCHQECQLPCIVTIDQSLFDSVKKTLIGGQKSVTFGNLRGEDLKSIKLKIDVSSNDDFISSSSVFIYHESQHEVEPDSHFRAVPNPGKPRLFDLICSSGHLRLDAANRKSRESLLLSLAFANFKGKLSSLTPETPLFPSYENDAELDSMDEASLQPNLDDSLEETDSKSLQAKLAAMHRLLESKDSAISKLQRELVASDADKRKVEKDFESCRNSESSVKDLLERCETTLEEKNRRIDGLKEAHRNAEMAQERTVRSLNNEKATLQATIEVRDAKIEGLVSQISELETHQQAQSEQLSSIESLKTNLAQTQEKYSSTEKVVAKMKETEYDLQKDLKNAKSLVLDLNDKFLAATENLTKRESDCRKLKMERNSLKNRAEGLSKEMMRKSKNNLKALEIEKLKTCIQELKLENSDLQNQIEVAKSEKREALGKLEATSLAHQQSVSYQLSVEENNGSCVSEQRVDELESVISSMTEYLNAKEMQIETLKQVNEVLTKDLNELLK